LNRKNNKWDEHKIACCRQVEFYGMEEYSGNFHEPDLLNHDQFQVKSKECDPVQVEQNQPKCGLEEK
jgi:hypothetical protein